MRIHRNDTGVEYWLYFDTERKNGVIYTVWPDSITLYELKDGTVTQKKRLA